MKVCKKWKKASEDNAVWMPLCKSYYLFENGTFTEDSKMPTQKWKDFFKVMINYEEQMMSEAFEEFHIDDDEPQYYEDPEWTPEDEEAFDEFERYPSLLLCEIILEIPWFHRSAVMEFPI
jgi:hypothetical protein